MQNIIKTKLSIWQSWKCSQVAKLELGDAAGSPDGWLAAWAT